MGARPAVLLADDDRALRKLVATTLGRGEFEVLEAADGAEALRLARARRPRVAVLDVVMPGPDGFEVCRRLKDDPATAGIRVVLLTALGAPTDQARGSDAGADAYLRKPFSPRELLDTVHRLLA